MPPSSLRAPVLGRRQWCIGFRTGVSVSARALAAIELPTVALAFTIYAGWVAIT